MGAVLSELARNALIDAGSDTAADQATASGFGFEPLAHRGPAVSNALIDRLREDEPA